MASPLRSGPRGAVLPLKRASAQAAPSGVGDAGAHGQAEIGAVGFHLSKSASPPRRDARSR
jgi:hypothetical protein